VSQLSRLIRLIGGMGVGVELSTSSAAAFKTASSSFYLIFRDLHRSGLFANQLCLSMLENIRSQPLPVNDVASEEETVLAEQLKKTVFEDGHEIDLKVRLFQLARISIDNGKDLFPSKILKALNCAHC
jgi:hypothetical protein